MVVLGPVSLGLVKNLKTKKAATRIIISRMTGPIFPKFNFFSTYISMCLILIRINFAGDGKRDVAVSPRRVKSNRFDRNQERLLLKIFKQAFQCLVAAADV